MGKHTTLCVPRLTLLFTEVESRTELMIEQTVSLIQQGPKAFYFK